MIAFLFDESDNEDKEQPFFTALGSAAGTEGLRSRVFYGSLLLHTLARQLVAGERRPDRTSYTYHFDKRTFKTLAIGLGEELMTQSRSVADDILRVALYSKQLWCFALANCTTEFADEVDGLLRTAARSYLGYIDVELGSPMQYQLFVGMLSNGKQIDGRTLYESWPEAQQLSDDLSPYSRVAVQEFDFLDVADPAPQPTPTTPSGSRLLTRFHASLERGASPLITRAVRQAFNEGVDFAIDSPTEWNVRKVGRELSPEGLRRKLQLYSLNPNSDHGKHKARVFASALGITLDEWLYLAAQIARAAPGGRIYGIKETQYGIQFSMEVTVSGLNQNIASVVTGWIIEKMEVRIVTAYVNKNNASQAADAPRSLRVAGETQELRYQAILDLAHQQGAEAGAQTLPTPELLEINGNHYVVPELGLATVHVKDARRSFVRWLLRTGNASRSYESGVLVFVRTEDQTLEKSEAYAQAFAHVLLENGVPCEVRSHAD